MADDFDPDAYLEDRTGGGDAPAPSGAFNPDQYIAGFNPDDYLSSVADKPRAETPLKTFGREAAHGVLPAAGGLLAGAGGGALAGAAGGAIGGPVGSAIGAVGGAIVGGLAGAYGTDKVQEAALSELGYDDSQQRAANAQENPKSAFAGQMAPALATMRPDRAAGPALRAASGGLMGGIEAGQELYNEGTVSPGRVAAAAGAGAILPSPNRVGRVIVGAGERAGQRVASAVPGRPNKPANPASVPEQAEAAQANDQPIVTGETSLEQPAPAVVGDTVGNPQSSPGRSERQYGKGQAPTGEAPDMLTQGDVSPDIAQALQANTGPAPEDKSIPRVAAENTWLGEDAPSPQQRDFGYNGTQPVDTGIVEAAQQPRTTGNVVAINDVKNAREFLRSLGHTPQEDPEYFRDPVKWARAAGWGATPEEIAASKQSLRDMGENPDNYIWPATQQETTPPPAAQQAIARSKANAKKPTLSLKQPEVPAFDDIPESQPSPTPVEPKGPNAGKPTLSLKPREESAPANPIHDKIVEAREAVTHGDDITPAQASADNYTQGHPGRMFGRMVTLETPKGGVRVDKSSNPPKWRNENYPTDYFKILGTKGADGDHIDMHYVGTGDRHFVIDQRNPETGKFDEHKVMSYAKDAPDAVDHYVRGFSDERGLDRLGSIKEVSEGDLKAWLAKPGAKRTPFDPEFKSAAGPTEGEKPLPKIVTAAVTKMRERGLPEDAIAKFMALEPSKRLGEASKFVNESADVSTRPDRIRTPAPTVEGIVTDEGKPVTARSKADAANKSRDVQKMNDAYEAVKARFPEEMPTTPEARKELYENLQSFLNATKDVKYRPNFKHAPYLLARAAKKLTLAKKPTDKGWTEFAEVMHQLRAGNEADVRQGQRIEADIGRSRRSGDEAIANAEAKNAGTNDVEDAMIRALDAKRGFIDVPHEEESGAPAIKTPVKSREELQAEANKGAIDLTKPEGQKELAKALGSEVGEPKPVTKQVEAERKAAITASEGAASPVRKVELKDKAALNAKYAAMLEQANKKGASHSAELDALPSDVKDLKPAAKDLFEQFLRNDSAELNVNKMMGDLLDFFKGTAARLRPQPKAAPYLGVKSHFAKTPTSMQHELQHSLSNELHQIRQQDIDDKLHALKQLNALPAEMDEKARADIYHAREAGTIDQLPPKLKAMYDKHIKPILDENDRLYDNIVAIDPSKMGPEVQDHIYRILKGPDAEHDLLRSGESPDPVEGVNAITTAAKGPALARRFVSLERQDGKRFVIGLNDDGFTIWNKYKSQKVVDPTFDFKAGDKIKVGNNTFTMKEALTPEIEANAKMESGQKAQYYHNAPMSAVSANVYLKSLARHLQYLHNLKSDPIFKQFAVPPGKAAPADYVSTSLPNFKDWKMDPRLAHAFDDFAQPGFNETSLNWLRRISQGVTKTIFWMPTAHINNVGTHWFVERGWNWLPGSGGYRSLAVNGAKAIKSVIGQDELQSQLRQHGAGTIYGGILSQGFMDQLGKAAGEMIRKNPAKWDPIARVMGVGPSTLADAVYKGASRVMWAANDMLLTHAVLENMDQKGLSMPDAIARAERHIPNYRVPPELLTGGRLGRVLSQIMQEPSLTAFGRYHYGVFNSYAHMVKDLVKGTGAQRKEAIGNLFALGLLSFAVYPALDKAWQSLTDNPDAAAQRRGPLAIPHHLERAREGKEDLMGAARSTVTTSPLITTAWEALANKDFRGKQIVEPGDVKQAGQGSLPAAARVVSQEAQHVGQGLISPLSTFGKERPDQGRAATLRDQALDIRNPTPAARKYEANAARTTLQQSRSRFKHPNGILESATNKLFGY